ncbi:hypothetical protein FRC17_007164, partial [Serendipita sp. 399]
MMRIYGVPYLWVNSWLVLITFLQHTDPMLPHYRASAFNFQRGALSTLDRSLLGGAGPFFGWLGGFLTHGISETHVLHHVCSKIPHYHAWEASDALRKRLASAGIRLQGAPGGWSEVIKTIRQCKFVEDEGDVVFYKDAHGKASCKAVWNEPTTLIDDYFLAPTPSTMSHKRKRDTTTLLPKSLRDEIESKVTEGGFGFVEQGSQSRKPSHYGKKSRKEKRILDRTAKKERKAAYFALQSKRRSSLGDGESPVFKRRKVQEDGPKQVKNIQQQEVKEFSKGKKHERTGVTTTHKKTTSKAKPESKPKPLLSQVEADEDREIAWLEYKLGISHKEKGKSLNKIMKKEGLDDLLDGLDDLFVEDPESGDEVYEEELSIEADDASPSSGEREEERNDDSEDDKPEEIEGQESEVRSGDEQEEQDDAENSSEHAPNINAPVKPATYVPPQLRQAPTDEDAKRTRLLRHLKGLMNRLSEQNIATVLSSVEDIYRQHTRNDVTTCLTSVI